MPLECIPQWIHFSSENVFQPLANGKPWMIAWGVRLPALGSADAAAMEIGGTLSPELAIPPQRLV